MRRSMLLVAVVTLGMIAFGNGHAYAQGLNQRDKLFLLYNQINNQRAQQQLSGQQQMLQQSFNRYTQQQSTGRVPYGYTDPVEAYVNQVQAGAGGSSGMPGRAYVPRIYGGGNIRRYGSFQQQYRYFNPQRSPLY